MLLCCLLVDVFTWLPPQETQRVHCVCRLVLQPVSPLWHCTFSLAPLSCLNRGDNNVSMLLCCLLLNVKTWLPPQETRGVHCVCRLVFQPVSPLWHCTISLGPLLCLVQQKVWVHPALPKAATNQKQVHFKGLVADVILTCTALVCNYRKQSEI